MYEERWYECDVWETAEVEPPDFSKVPEHKRHEVEERFWERHRTRTPTRWKMWGPQIPTFQRPPYHDRVVVV